VLDGDRSRAALQPTLRLVLVGVAAGAAMAAVTYVVYPALARVLPFVPADMALLYSAFRAPSPAIAAIALAPLILGEELVWRGLVQGAIVRRLGSWPGVTLAAAVYALALAPLGVPALIMGALLCGIAWGALRVASGSLVPPLVAHLVWDVAVLIWRPLESS
jgi:uncharacterized protein